MKGYRSYYRGGAGAAAATAISELDLARINICINYYSRVKSSCLIRNFPSFIRNARNNRRALYGEIDISSVIMRTSLFSERGNKTIEREFWGFFFSYLKWRKKKRSAGKVLSYDAARFLRIIILFQWGTKETRPRDALGRLFTW